MSLNVKTALRKANTLARRGDLAGAATLYREILQLFPQNQQARKQLAALTEGSGVTPKPVSQTPRDDMLAVVKLFQTGLADEALQRGGQLASQYPQDPMIHNFTGVVFAHLGRLDEAVQRYQAALQLKPDYAEAWFNLGVACQGLQRLDEAIEAYSRAVRHDPGHANAYCGLGSAFKEAGKFGKALSSYSRAIELNPGHAQACNNLGSILRRLGRADEALHCFTRAVALDPRNAESLSNLGHAQSEVHHYAEAIASYTSALRLRPDMNNARAGVAYLQAMQCDWKAAAEALANIPPPQQGGEAVGPFVMLGLEDDPEMQLARARQYAQQTFGRIEPLAPFRPNEEKRERLKIGYFSCEFHQHATMYLMIRLLELHDPEAFEIHAFSYGPPISDYMSRRVRDCVASFHDVRALGDREIAALARSEGIDIAVDLKGYTQSGRPEIFAYRAAPVQVSYLGFPGASGIDEMDYIVADAVVIPEAQQGCYNEKVIYMPHSYQVNDNGRAISDRAVSRPAAGLPETGFVFCCFNNSYKISPREFAIWMRLLLRVEGSVLWLLRTNSAAVANLRREAESRGIAGERLVFAEKMPLAEHLARHRLADLFLDTFTYNAHTTASDALWAGVPVLTRPGNAFAARVGASLVRAAGLAEMVASSDEEYEQLALELALNPGRLAALRAQLAANRESCPLFDSELFTRQIESAYRLAFQRYQEGSAPDCIRVPAA